jgi:HD-like signal output (HDOD) protein
MVVSEALEQAIKSVRPLPTVAQRILALVQDPEYRIDDLVALVRTDPSLVARVLRLCNSARQGLEHPLTSITDAIAYLGTRNLLQLVLVSCSTATFATVNPSSWTDPGRLWRHAVATAVLCQFFARSHGEAHEATAFTLGILHGIGGVAFATLAADDRIARALAAHGDTPRDGCQLEVACFGADHAELAGRLALRWQLPRSLVTGLAGHHEARVLAGDDPLPALLHLADRTAGQLGFAATGFPLRHDLDAAALTRLRTDPKQVAALLPAATAAITAATELLNLGAAASR